MTEEVKDVVLNEAKEETVSKADYDKLNAEYKKIVSAFNKLVGIVANDYADKLIKSLFAEAEEKAE